ncbi:MAG: S1C family serine protease [Anaerolineae bacterium]
MNKRFIFSVLVISLLAFLLISCAAATYEAQSPPLAVDLKDLVLPENQDTSSEPAEIVTQLPFDENTLIGLYERVNPAVVNIRVVKQMDTQSGDNQPTLPQFPEIPGFPSIPQPEPGPQQGLGSGFVYDREGHIVTNNHVVAGADRIVVTFADNTEVDAALVGTDPDNDLAVIQVDVDQDLLAPIPLGDSESLKVGQLVVAIGNPFGLEGSMTTGIVSGLGRMLPAGSRTPSGDRFSIPDIIQTDAAINPGNSGGPLLNINGELVGVNTAIESPVRGFAGIGYAVPSNTVAEVVPQLIEKGVVEHPWLGIAGTTLTGDLARAMNLEDQVDGGVLVTKVVADSPADKAELRGSDTETEIDGIPVLVGGDVIVGIDDRPVQEFDDLLGYIVHETAVGQTVTLHVVRGSNADTLDIQVTLEARPTETR